MEFFSFVPNHDRLFFTAVWRKAPNAVSTYLRRCCTVTPATLIFTVLAAISRQNLIKMKANKRYPIWKYSRTGHTSSRKQNIRIQKNDFVSPCRRLANMLPRRICARRPPRITKMLFKALKTIFSPFLSSWGCSKQAISLLESHVCNNVHSKRSKMSQKWWFFGGRGALLRACCAPENTKTLFKASKTIFLPFLSTWRWYNQAILVLEIQVCINIHSKWSKTRQTQNLEPSSPLRWTRKSFTFPLSNVVKVSNRSHALNFRFHD
jgi:hypothetical protein